MELNSASTYRKDLYYINKKLGNGNRRECRVSCLNFYLTWFNWFLHKNYRKFKNFNVLYEE